jgi:hypothetical protein
VLKWHDTHKWGVFTTEAIDKGTYVTLYGGSYVDIAHVTTGDLTAQRKKHIYIDNDNKCIDGFVLQEDGLSRPYTPTPPNTHWGSLIQRTSSDTYNCTTEENPLFGVLVIAISRIEEGSQLVLKYIHEKSDSVPHNTPPGLPPINWTAVVPTHQVGTKTHIRLQENVCLGLFDDKVISTYYVDKNDGTKHLRVIFNYPTTCRIASYAKRSSNRENANAEIRVVDRNAYLYTNKDIAQNEVVEWHDVTARYNDVNRRTIEDKGNWCYDYPVRGVHSVISSSESGGGYDNSTTENALSIFDISTHGNANLAVLDPDITYWPHRRQDVDYTETLATYIVSLQNKKDERLYNDVDDAIKCEFPKIKRYQDKTKSNRLRDVIKNSKILELRYNDTVGWGAHRCLKVCKTLSTSKHP